MATVTCALNLDDLIAFPVRLFMLLFCCTLTDLIWSLVLDILYYTRIVLSFFLFNLDLK